MPSGCEMIDRESQAKGLLEEDGQKEHARGDNQKILSALTPMEIRQQALSSYFSKPED